MSLAELCASYYRIPSVQGSRAPLSLNCTILHLPLVLQPDKPCSSVTLGVIGMKAMRLQNEWFDMKVNQDGLGELEGTIVDNLPFTAAARISFTSKASLSLWLRKDVAAAPEQAPRLWCHSAQS